MGPLGAILGNLGAIQEEKRHPQNHSGAVLSVFWPLFWVPKDLYHILGQCVGPCWTSANYWELFGVIWGNFRWIFGAPFQDLDSLSPEYCSGAILSLFWAPKDPNPVQ